MEDNIRLLEMERSWPTEPLPLSPALDIDRLAEQTKVEKQKVFAIIDEMRDEAIALLQDLVRIRSVNPSTNFEKELADFVADKMRELNMEVRQIEPVPNRVSNLAIFRGTEGEKTLLVNSHLDTVPEGSLEEWTVPPFDAQIVGDRLIGRGSKDCKLGMAASIVALAAIQRAGVTLHGNYMITTTADEESGGAYGIAHLIDKGWVKADYCIYAEGWPERLTIGARGLCHVEITVRGKTSHTSTKNLGINAIVKMAQVIKAIDSMTFTNWQPHPIVPGNPTASVNIIKGGFKENVIPDRCSIIVDIRFLPGMTIQGVLNDVERVLDKLRAHDPFLGGLDVSVKVLSVGRPVFTSPDDPFVKVMAKAVSDVTGNIPYAAGMVASSDARWIVHDAAIPTIMFSMGNDTAHVPNEYVLLEHYIDNIKIYAETALMLLVGKNV